MLLRAPGLTTRNKKLLGAPGIATRSILTTSCKSSVQRSSSRTISCLEGAVTYSETQLHSFLFMIAPCVAKDEV